MASQQSNSLLKIIVVLTYLGMVVVNGLATALPINGQTTGAVSDSFPNLFAPAGLTFSIWGAIYLLLAAYTLYQLGLFQEDRGVSRGSLFRQVGIYFSLSSLANAGWIFAWHYNQIALSLLLMIILLVLLILIVLRINTEKDLLSLRERFFIKLPFSVYFGWITVATIANVTSLLASRGWDGFGLAEETWTVLVIAVGLVIALITMLRLKDIAYGLVIIWAYAGIWIKHSSAENFAGQYPAVIGTVIIAIVLLAVAEAYLLFFPGQRATA